VTTRPRPPSQGRGRHAFKRVPEVGAPNTVLLSVVHRGEDWPIVINDHVIPQKQTASSQGPLSKKLRINERSQESQGQPQTILQQLVACDDILIDTLVDHISYSQQIKPITNELRLTFI
jgi:hypothetical protein